MLAWSAAAYVRYHDEHVREVTGRPRSSSDPPLMTKLLGEHLASCLQYLDRCDVKIELADLSGPTTGARTPATALLSD